MDLRHHQIAFAAPSFCRLVAQLEGDIALNIGDLAYYWKCSVEDPELEVVSYHYAGRNVPMMFLVKPLQEFLSRPEFASAIKDPAFTVRITYNVRYLQIGLYHKNTPTVALGVMCDKQTEVQDD